MEILHPPYWRVSNTFFCDLFLDPGFPLRIFEFFHLSMVPSLQLLSETDPRVDLVRLLRRMFNI